MLPLIRERMRPRVFSAIGNAIGMDASQHGKEALSKVAADGIDHPAPAQATSRRIDTLPHRTFSAASDIQCLIGHTVPHRTRGQIASANASNRHRRSARPGAINCLHQGGQRNGEENSPDAPDAAKKQHGNDDQYGV